MTGADALYAEQIIYHALSSGLPRAPGRNLRVPADSRAAATRVGLLAIASLDAAMQAFARTCGVQVVGGVDERPAVVVLANVQTVGANWRESRAGGHSDFWARCERVRFSSWDGLDPAATAASSKAGPDRVRRSRRDARRDTGQSPIGDTTCDRPTCRMAAACLAC